jgi:hypothetical protein
VGTFTRRSASKKPMGRVSLLVVAIGGTIMLAGCGHNDAKGRDCSGGVIDGDHCVPYTAGQKAAIQVAQMRIPPLDGDPLVNVTCRVGEGMAICKGQMPDKRWIRGQRFTVDSRGALEPVCREPPPGGVFNIFCAQ